MSKLFSFFYIYNRRLLLTYCTIEAILYSTIDRHKTSRGLSATAWLLVVSLLCRGRHTSFLILDRNVGLHSIKDTPTPQLLSYHRLFPALFFRSKSRSTNPYPLGMSINSRLPSKAADVSYIIGPAVRNMFTVSISCQ